jgi:hypothetical protein
MIFQFSTIYSKQGFNYGLFRLIVFWIVHSQYEIVLKNSLLAKVSLSLTIFLNESLFATAI